MSTFAISLVLAFIISGFIQVHDDLSARPLHRPMWAFHPTPGKVFLVGVTWFLRPFMGLSTTSGLERAEKIAYGLIHVLAGYASLTLLFWGTITAVGFFVTSILWKTVIVIAALTLGLPILGLITGLVVAPVTLAGVLVIGLVFSVLEKWTRK